MNPREPREEWEEQLHRELMALPEIEAPATLLPSVLRRLPPPSPEVWYQASWWEWPRALRWASVVMALLLLALLGWASGTLPEAGLGQRALEFCQSLTQTASLFLDVAERLLASPTMFWRQHGQILLWLSATFCLATYLICVAAGTALYRLAWRRIA